MSTAAGLQIIELKTLERESEDFIVARGVVNIVSLVSFFVLVTIVSNKPVQLQK